MVSISAPTRCRVSERHGVPHHLIDIADPIEDYTAARYAHDAARAIRDIHARRRLPIVVGGTGLYYRALTRGLFPGPGKNVELRARLERVADRKGSEALHRLVARVDPPSGDRIQPRDRKRLIRALEVYFVTGRPLTAHFADTVSPLDPDVQVTAIALSAPLPWLSERLAQTRRRTVCFGAARRDPRPARRRCAGECSAIWRPGLPAGARTSAWCARRGGDPRAHRAREPSLCATAVDLVPKRA